MRPPDTPLALTTAPGSTVTLPCADCRLIVPPVPALPTALTTLLVSTRTSPCCALTSILPPRSPSTLMRLPCSTDTDFVAFRNIRPSGPRTSWLALITPLLRTTAPTMPTRPDSAMIEPRFSALLFEAVISTLTPGAPLSISLTLLPAARMVSPCGVWITPSLVTFVPTRYTYPPTGVVMLPLLITLPAPGWPWKFIFPAAKSAFDRFRVEATKPPTSMRAPAPTKTPAGLIRNTRPLDCSAPRITDGSGVTTRFRTLEAALCWMNLVVSLALIENPCQLMTAPGVFVIDSVVPLATTLACPLTTCGPTGFAYTSGNAKHAATKATRAFFFGCQLGTTGTSGRVTNFPPGMCILCRCVLAKTHELHTVDNYQPYC